MLLHHYIMLCHPEPGLESGDAEPEHFSRDYVQGLREEARRYRQRATEQEQRLQAAEAAFGNATRDFQTRLDEAGRQAGARLVQLELRAAAERAGIVDLDGLRLVDTTAVTLADDGSVQGAEALVESLKTAKPWLFAAVDNAGHTASRARPLAPHTPELRRATDMSEAEYRQEKARLLGQGSVPRH